MNPDSLPVTTYLQLRERVDQFGDKVVGALAASMACRAGCDSCCRLESVFPVEGYLIYQALLKLPLAEVLLLSAAEPIGEADCPLLRQGRCSIYSERPLICRTHGLPLLLKQEGVVRIDHCPLNFKDIDRLPGELVLQLEAVNQPLAVINQLFLQQELPDWKLSSERIKLSELLQRARKELQ